MVNCPTDGSPRERINNGIVSADAFLRDNYLSEDRQPKKKTTIATAKNATTTRTKNTSEPNEMK